jgi:hypothetical protein
VTFMSPGEAVTVPAKIVNPMMPRNFFAEGILVVAELMISLHF